MIESDKAVFTFSQDTPLETIQANFAAFPQHDRYVLSGEFPAEWRDLEPFTYYKVSRLHELISTLKIIGPVSSIVYAWRGDSAEHLRVLRNIYFHLKSGGTYTIPWSSVSGGRGLIFDRFDAFSRRLVSQPSDNETTAIAELVRAIAEVRINRIHLQLEKRGEHLLKLRDEETNHVLPRRSPVAVRDVSTSKPGVLSFSHPVDSQDTGREVPHIFNSIKYPKMHLRRYQGSMAFVSNSLVYTENSVLPDSFRHHLERHPRNPKLTNVGPGFGRVEPNLEPSKRLNGTYYLLDSENSGHFGHLLTEVVSRLWGWDRAKAEDPNVKALFRIRYANERIPNLEREVFQAYGIPREDIVWVDAPVWLENLWAATPQFHNQKPHYIHPDIRKTWRRIREGLPVVDIETFERIFISRGSGLTSRRCLNQDAVEREFQQAGYKIVLPEHYSLSEQASIFKNARVIAGFGGSAMFNAIFAEKLEHMIVLNHEAYRARNEHLIAMALGVKLTYLWSRPQVEHPVDGWSREAYRSDWEFDFHRHSRGLQAILDV